MTSSSTLTQKEVLDRLSHVDIEDSCFGDGTFVMQFATLFDTKEDAEDLIAYLKYVVKYEMKYNPMKMVE